MNTRHERFTSSMKTSVGAMLCAATLGCGAGSDASAGAFGDDEGSGTVGPGVGQGGAQDFGQFRTILEAGQIPAPQTLDDVGFFNEHKVELPSPDCGAEVCLHGQLGVMGNMITGSNCTIVTIGMNTPIDPAEMERPPLDLALVIDTSGSMAGEPIQYVREGLVRMLDDVRPEDRVSIIAFSDRAEVLVEGVGGDRIDALQDAIDRIDANGQTNIYDGLRTGYDLVAANAEEGRQTRVVLLSDGEATVGITNTSKIVAMSAAYNDVGHSLTTIGVGTDFDPVLMRELSESGGGAFYYLEDPSAVQEVFEQEITTFLVPLARDLRIDVDIEPGWSLRAMYGTKLFELDGNDASIAIPSVQIAHRETVDDDFGGRRGGGGAIVVELIPTSTSAAVGTVGNIAMTYERPTDGEIVAQQVPVVSTLAAGELPEDGAFDGAAVEKSFVMLNVFVGFRLASERAMWGDDAGALSTLLALRDSVAQWLVSRPDEDIADDLRYVDMFIANLRARGAGEPAPTKNPPEPWPAD
jgi:Ca-activated chloride channel family protein